MPTKEEKREIKSKYTVGMRVVLLKMHGEPQMKAGLLGIIDGVDDEAQIHVCWESGSSLALIVGLDEFIIVKSDNH